MLNRESSVPIYIQIQEQLEQMLQEGILKPNDLVPSENEMAEQLKVSRLTVRKSYGEMVKRGLFYTIQGKGTYVKGTSNANMSSKKQEIIQRRKIIGVILPEVVGFYGDIFSGIMERCKSGGYSVQLMFNNEISNEITAIEQMLTSDVTGIIISPSRHANTIIEHYQKLLNAQVPTVMVGKPPFKISAPCVYCDDTMGVYRAVEVLLSHENTRIGYVGCSTYQDEASSERYAGYLAAMRDYLPTTETVLFDMESPKFEEEIAKSQRGDSPVTAFFCYCDAAAAQVYGLLTQLGRRVPEEVEVIGYDNMSDPMGGREGKQLTSVDQRRALMGSETVSLLWRIMEDPESKHTHTEIVVHPKVVEKETTRTDMQ